MTGTSHSRTCVLLAVKLWKSGAMAGVRWDLRRKVRHIETHSEARADETLATPETSVAENRADYRDKREYDSRSDAHRTREPLSRGIRKRALRDIVSQRMFERLVFDILKFATKDESVLRWTSYLS